MLNSQDVEDGRFEEDGPRSSYTLREIEISSQSVVSSSSVSSMTRDGSTSFSQRAVEISSQSTVRSPVISKSSQFTDADFDAQHDRAQWPALKAKLAAAIKTKTRDEWDEIMLGTDVCYAPILSLSEAPNHPHNVARKTFVEIDGVTQPNVAPRGRARSPGPRPRVAIRSRCAARRRRSARRTGR